MTPKYLWPVVLMALYILPIQSLNCAHLDQAIKENLKLLHNFIKGFPFRCIKDITNFKFPKETLLPYIQHMKTDINVVFHQVSALALNIFTPKSYILPVPEKDLEIIKSGLFNQAQQAQQCFMEEKKENREEASMSQDLHSEDFLKVYLELRKYFFRIRKFLTNKKYSFCAFKIVAAEIKRCFIIFYHFKNEIRYISESMTFKQELR
ncbi:interferon kappa [Arvicanthis niloticus]|uniref:interferon kappa n=1 Tax=Arvicanthis niloticus TaxID=61156 RepID=UPI001485F45D|nr:interferon kappa [Arvicanthis niloticus]